MEQIIYASNKAMLLIVILSAIPVMVATAVGLLVGLIQTVTQLQEQTLPFGIGADTTDCAVEEGDERRLD